MHSSNVVTLRLTASGIDAYCRELSVRSATLEKRVSAMDALITFISSQADAGEQAKPEFSAIKQILRDHFEQARAALLDDRALRLRQALQAQSVSRIAGLFASLSRDAFWTLLATVEQQLDPDARSAVRSWASAWMDQTREQARESSPYPDAIDFNAAGIDVSEYLAMTDLCRVLGVTR